MMNMDDRIPRFIQNSTIEVFLSYSSGGDSESEKYIDNLKTGLASHKIKVITAPHDQIGGDDANEYILSKIRACDVFLVLHTESCKSSDYFDQEIGMAFASNIPIIPICVKQLPYGFIVGRKCIRCDDSITDKIQTIAYAIRRQYWNQRTNQPKMLFRLNMIDTKIKASRLLFLMNNIILERHTIDQLAVMYLSNKFSDQKSTTYTIERILTKNRDDLSSRLSSALQKYNNKNLKV